MIRVKVLYLAQHLTMGGAEELLRQVATRLPADRFEVVVGCLTREGIIGSELRRAGVRVVLLPGEPGPRSPRAFRRLLRFIRAERPEIVHTFLLTAGLYGRLAAWLARVPAIYHTEQNVYVAKPRRHVHFERFLAARTTRIIACCRAVADFYQQQVGPDPRRLDVIYNAVDFSALRLLPDRDQVRAELGYQPDDLVMGCLGRLADQKGHDVLLDAMAQLRSDEKLHLFLAGEGPRRNELERQAARLGLAQRIQFLGVRRDRDVLYTAMDVFVLPSRWEGLSLALVEAAGSGLPIITTSVGGNPEVVQGGPGTWLVQPDDRAGLREALALAGADIRERHGAGGRRHYHRPGLRERFSLARHLALLEASYRWSLGLPAPEGQALPLAPS